MGDATTGKQVTASVLSLVAVGSLPYVNFLAANRAQPVDMVTVGRWWTVTVAGAIIIAVVASAGRSRLFVRAAAGLVPFVWWAFQYRQTSSGLVWWAVAAAIGAVMVIGSRIRVVQALTVVVPAALLAAVLPLAVTAVTASPPTSAGPVFERPAGDLPNIWLFVPDGFTSLEQVKRQAGLDLTGFRHGLERRGFVVPDGVANYPTSYLSLASMLEMDYVADVGDDVTDRSGFYTMIGGDNATVATLTSWGYRYVHAHPGLYDGSACSGLEDVCVAPGRWSNETRSALRSLTPLPHEMGSFRQLADHSDPEFLVRQVREQDVDGPKFVFAHLMEPHPPSFRTAGCDVRDDVVLDFTQARWNPDRYAESLTCLTGQLLAAIDRIVAQDPDAIIVIQADHGTRKDAGDWTGTPPSHRYDVLSAIRVPDRCMTGIPSPVAAVNTFRLVFGCIDGSEVDLLDVRLIDVNYASTTVRG